MVDTNDLRKLGLDEAEIEVMVDLRQRHLPNDAMLTTLELGCIRLEFAAWLYEHGKINDGTDAAPGLSGALAA